MDKLHDIKPLIAITDYSMFLFVATILVGIVLAFILFKKSYKYASTHCKVCCEKYFFTQYSKIDWSNPKKAAYEATHYGMLLARDRRRKELFRQLRERLDKYKYKQDYNEVDKDTLNYFNLYKQVCDESI